MKGLLFGLFLFLIVSMFIDPAFAATPIEQFVFQGVLKDSNGGPITGVKNVTLRIFDIPTGGTNPGTVGANSCLKTNHCFWQENQTRIAFVNGLFTINAGNTTSLGSRLNFTNALYLEVVIRNFLSTNTVGNDRFGNDEVMTPRINMTASPFALSAARASGNLDLNKKDIFNATSLGINSTRTTTNALNVTAGSLTTGSALNIGSTSGSTGTRNLASIANRNTAATGTTVLALIQVANQIAQQITSSSTTANILNVTAGKLTTGSAVNVGSTSGSTGTRALLNVTNTNTAATGTTVLQLQQGSTGDIVDIFNSTGARTVQIRNNGFMGLSSSNVTASRLQVFGSFALPIVAKTTHYNVTDKDFTILCNPAAGKGIAITLPTPVGIQGRMYDIKFISTSGATTFCTVVPNVTGKIDGNYTQRIGTTNGAILVQSDGANWWVLANATRAVQ